MSELHVIWTDVLLFALGGFAEPNYEVHTSPYTAPVWREILAPADLPKSPHNAMAIVRQLTPWGQ